MSTKPARKPTAAILEAAVADVVMVAAADVVVAAGTAEAVTTVEEQRIGGKVFWKVQSSPRCNFLLMIDY